MKTIVLGAFGVIFLMCVRQLQTIYKYKYAYNIIGAVTELKKSKTQRVGSCGGEDGGSRVNTKHLHTHINKAANRASG